MLKKAKQFPARNGGNTYGTGNVHSGKSNEQMTAKRPKQKLKRRSLEALMLSLPHYRQRRIKKRKKELLEQIKCSQELSDGTKP